MHDIIILSTAECDVGEIDESNATLQDSVGQIDDAVLFLLPDPIDCNGTLTSFNISGFCSFTRPHMLVAVRLRLFRRQSTSNVYTAVPLPRRVRNFTATCENHTSNTTCSIYADLRGEINVFTGDYLGVRFRSNLDGNICTIEPAVASNTNSHFLYLSVPVRENERRAQKIHIEDGNSQNRNGSLQFFARISGAGR